MDGLSIAASIIAVVDLSTKTALLCSQYYRDVKDARDDISRLKREASQLESTFENVRSLLDSPDGARLKASQPLRTAVEESLARLQVLEKELRPSKGRRAVRVFSLRALTWPFKSKDVDKIVQDLRRCTETVSLALQVDQTTVILNLVQKTVLSRLPIADGAAFDSHAEEHNPTCYPGTRVDLLREISQWAGDTEGKPIFWLNGMAGTGKSTISRTVAQSFSKRRQLGASFFFKRGEGDREGASRLFTTIAAQLVRREPEFASHVQAAIDADPRIFEKKLRNQFEELIWKPWTRITRHTHPASTVSIVIDALDECGRGEDIETIIQILSETRSSQRPLRIFVTSRPELPIRLGFTNIEGAYRNLILHEVPKQAIENDLFAFLVHELGNTRDNYNKSVQMAQRLPQTWPEQRVVQELVEMAAPLFIFAATVCRFIKDPAWHNPEGQLKKVLDYKTKTPDSGLDKLAATYSPILDQLLFEKPKREAESLINEFREVVGPIVLLARPLSVLSLAKLLSIDPRVITGRLDSLHSVLNIPPDIVLPVRPFHKSFHDYLVNVERRDSNPFWVDEKATHEKLAINCLRIMDETLRTDICGIKWPGAPLSSVDPQIIRDKLQPEVQYACLYWVDHIKESGRWFDVGDAVYGFLQRHFLHWLEALSLMGETDRSYSMLDWLQLNANARRTKLACFVENADSFLTKFGPYIEAGPLYIYSALVFDREESVVRNTFKNCIPDWLCVAARIFGPTLPFSASPGSVALSPDSKLAMLGLWEGTVQVWSTDTGELQHTLQGHKSSPRLISFSSDSKLIASGSKDKTVRLWSAETGAPLLICCLDNYARTLSFACDGQTILTETGTISTDGILSSTGPLSATLDRYSLLSLSQAASGHDRNHDLSNHFHGVDHWVYFNGNPLMRGTIFRRDQNFAVSGSVAVISHWDEIFIVKFSTEKLLGLLPALGS
ncbi:hypothetical protein GGS23DRAFT_567180 [Durotheca rogersii]|uniref:uncharacterized protein n=1 Tax=Durotheca rogersii TaxID=419775 RepID=UPI00221F9EEE|nr:uncharacterized protein GGS23DRAFT_567180 [Durotheca rogersii]KAI5863467.1 hypothetical protein GGS23DRAFT_567180 [Durotheca rogersii]